MDKDGHLLCDGTYVHGPWQEYENLEPHTGDDIIADKSAAAAAAPAADGGNQSAAAAAAVAVDV